MIEYDSKMNYTSQSLSLRTIKLDELMNLFQQAKQALNTSRDFKEKRKIQGDIQVIRMFLKYLSGV